MTEFRDRLADALKEQEPDPVFSGTAEAVADRLIEAGVVADPTVLAEVVKEGRRLADACDRAEAAVAAGMALADEAEQHARATDGLGAIAIPALRAALAGVTDPPTDHEHDAEWAVCSCGKVYRADTDPHQWKPEGNPQ